MNGRTQRGFIRSAAGVLLAVACGAALDRAESQPVSGTLPPGTATESAQMLDDASQSAIFGAVVAALDERALRHGNVFCVAFQIAPGTQAPGQPQGGFADALVPQGAPLQSDGLMEITMNERPSVWFSSLGQPGVLQGAVSLRISQYRIFTAATGWQPPQLVMLHVWEWGGTVQDGSFQLALTNAYAGRFASDDAFTEFVASVFNVPPESVVISRPAEQDCPPAQ